MKKIALYIFIIIIFVTLFSPIGNVSAQTTYQLLQPLPGVDEVYNTVGDNALGKYLNAMISVFIGICAVLAVVMIVLGGLEYMTSELPGNKEHGKERIRNAIFGLILALGAYALLFTINPELLRTDFVIPGVTVSVTLDDQIRQYAGKGKCEPIQSGPCSPAALAAAGFASGVEASSICNGESNGDATLPSGVDTCKDNNSFSFGLFQINAIAHRNEIPGGVCSGIFQVNGGGIQGACMPGKSKDGICFQRDCTVTDQAKYQTCKSYLTNPTNNIAYAKKLRADRTWEQWGAYNSCRGTTPPKFAPK